MLPAPNCTFALLAQFPLRTSLLNLSRLRQPMRSTDHPGGRPPVRLSELESDRIQEALGLRPGRSVEELLKAPPISLPPPVVPAMEPRTSQKPAGMYLATAQYLYASAALCIGTISQ